MNILIRFPLSDDNVLLVELQKQVSQKEFERIVKLIELSRDAIVRDNEPPEPTP